MIEVQVVGEIPASAKRLRIAIQEEELTIWNADVFKDPSSEDGRLFLSRVFSVEEIKSVVIDRRRGIGRLCYDLTAQVASILDKLYSVLSLSREEQDQDPGALSADSVFLESPLNVPIRIERVGGYLSTWQIKGQGYDWVQLANPMMRNRKDVAYRLEEELTAVMGVRDFKTRLSSGSILVRFNPRRLDVPRLLRHLEYRWPRLINGHEGPPPRARFFIATGLLTASFIGQFFWPVITPYALLGLVIYGFANIANAFKLLRQGKIGLPTLYCGTLTFTVLSGQPFAATLMGTFMQLWPQWAYFTLMKSQRRLFATHRQRAIWARRVISMDRTEEVNIDSLTPGDLILVNEGEIIPVDGLIVGGLAAVDEEALTGRAGALDKAEGDSVFAATFIKTGRITVRVDKVGSETLAGFIGEQLPHGKIDRLPESAEAEHIATEMVKPAFAVAGLNLLLTGNVIPSQSSIRPDYATAPRLSAQLSALHDLSDALRRGIVFRDPAAMSKLPSTDIYVFDDTPALERRRISVAEILTAPRVSTKTVLSYAASAFPAHQNDRARSLMDECLNQRAPLLEISQRVRHAGAIFYRDEDNNEIEVGTPAYIETRGLPIPKPLQAAVAKSPHAWLSSGRKTEKPLPHPEPQLRPLWVIRNNVILGVITFSRQGDLEAFEVISTLRARNSQAQFVHVSSRPQREAEALAERIGISTVFGGLNGDGKAEVVKRLGNRTIWIGDGSSPEASKCIKASTVSVSVAGLAAVPTDEASVILLQPSLRGIVPLRRIGRQHRALIKEGYRWVFVANLACVAGAFLADFTTLAVTLVSNFATGYVYTSHRLLLNDLIARMEAKMAKEVPSKQEEPEVSDSASETAPFERERVEEYAEQDLDEPILEARPV